MKKEKKGKTYSHIAKFREDFAEKEQLPTKKRENRREEKNCEKPFGKHRGSEIQQDLVVKTSTSDGKMPYRDNVSEKVSEVHTRTQRQARYKKDGKKEGREKGAARYSSRSICSRV